MDEVFPEAAPPPLPQKDLSDLLSKREIEILGRIADGQTNRQIADELFLSFGTVKWYTSEIYSKLGVKSRTQAIVRAKELKLLT